MSDYNTRNPVPSIDPRDLDDNATNFDLLLNSPNLSVPDRLGTPRKSWAGMEADAAILLNPNVSALAGLTLSANKGLYATGAAALATYDLTALGRVLGGIANAAAGRAALSAAVSGVNNDITSLTGLTTALSIAQGGTGNTAGSAVKLTNSRSIAITGDATWSVNFDGSANVTAALTLANSGVGAGTYGTVSVNAKGLVTAAQTVTPVANGGTGQATVGDAALALAAPKLAWTAYTPTVTASSGSFTAATASGSYIVLFGVCHFRAILTITTRGSGTFPAFTLPVPAMSGLAGSPLAAREGVVNGRSGTSRIQSGLTLAVCADSVGGDLVTADGAVIYIMGSYQVA